MIKGIRLILSGVAVIVIGCGMYAAPKEAEIYWYYPLPAFPLGLLLIFVGVRSLRDNG